MYCRVVVSHTVTSAGSDIIYFIEKFIKIFVIQFHVWKGLELSSDDHAHVIILISIVDVNPCNILTIFQ
jgi:hypothetical protein